MHDKGTQTLSAAAPTATTTTTNTSATPARNYTGVLRYADPKDLPGFPTLGVQNDEAAASAAASLGWANRKPVEIWKPDSSASASAAAFLAKDFKMSPSWQPSTGYDPKSPGAQAAALATQASTKAKVAPPASQPRSNGHASSASMSAVYASRRNQYSPPEDMSRNKGSLAAAKDAMAHFSTRPRSTSTPQPLRDNRRRDMSGSENALSAATIAHRPFSTTQIPIEEAGAVPYTTLPRKMFTATPPVRMEVDEQKRADMLHASAVAMAKTMYKQQQRMIDTTQVARQRELSNSKSESQLKTAVNLQEAAYKAAQERLNKLHDEHQKNRNYQEYYADPNAQPARRSTVLSKLRRRASSDGDLDRQQSERIRQQMSLFSSNLSKVDEQKRTKDREALLAVAQRNVRARLQGIDKKVYEDTGKITTSNKSDWESRATAAAKARHEARSNPNRGKIDIGGGKYLDAEEINAIAAKRLKPMLDEMDEMAAKERERQEILRLEAEEKREAAERERAKEQEIKNIHKKLVEQDRQEVKERQRHEKEEEKERKQHAKEEEKARKEEEKASKAAERKIAKEEKEEEKRKSREKTRKRPEEIMVPSQTEDDTRRITEPTSGQPSQQAAETSEMQPKQNNLSSPTSPTSPNSPASKMKGWLKARLSRPRRKSAGDGDSDGAEKRGFIGGIALRQREEEAIQSNSSLEHRSSSMRDVALAGKETEPSAAAASSVTTHADLAASGRARRDSLGVSIDESEEGSTAGEEEHYEEALDHHDFEGLSPPSALQNLNKPKSASPTRDSRFREMVD